MSRPAQQLALVLIIYCLAILLGEYQTRDEAGSTWYCLALIWITILGIDIWYVYG